MKKLLLTLIVCFALCGSTFAQHESHWPDFDYSSTSYSESDLLVAFVQIDGVFIELDYDNWDALEIAAFVNGEIRGCCFLTNAMEEFDDPHQEIELSIMRGFTQNDNAHTYNAEEGLPVTFQLYDHANGVLYTEFSTNIEVLTGMTWFEIYNMDYDNAPVLNFISPVIECQTKEIEPYEDVNVKDHYYLIASPVLEELNPDEVGMLNGEYDLYYFDQTADEEGNEWYNYNPRRAAA